MVAYQNPIVYYLVIPSGATSGQRIVINGVAGDIELYDSNNNEVGIISPQYQKWINSSNTGMIWIQPNGGEGTGSFPEIDFFTALTAGGYVNAAFMNCVPDSNGNPQIGINSGVETVGTTLARSRLFMAGQGAEKQLGMINANTQGFVFGNLQWDGEQAALCYYDDNGNLISSISATENGNLSNIPILSGTWQNATPQHGWSNNATYGPLQWRIMSDGMVHLRGVLSNASSAADSTVVALLPQAAEPPGPRFIDVVGDAGAINPRVVITPNGSGTNTTIAIYGLNGTTDIGFDSKLFDSAAYTS